MEYAIGYIVSVFVLQAIAAVRTPYHDCQAVIIGTVFWPLMLVLVAGSLFFDWIGWGFDMVKGAKMFGMRRPTNPNARGLAITVFGIEFQFYAIRKELVDK